MDEMNFQSILVNTHLHNLLQNEMLLFFFVSFCPNELNKQSFPIKFSSHFPYTTFKPPSSYPLVFNYLITFNVECRECHTMSIYIEK